MEDSLIYKKLAGAFTAGAFALVAAMLLLSTGGAGTAEAAIRGITDSPTTIAAGNEGVVTVDSDAGSGNVQLITTGGSFVAPMTCLDPGGGAGCDTGTTVIPAAGVGDAVTTTAVRNVTVSDSSYGGGQVDTVIIGIECPATGPATLTVTATQGSSASSTTVTCRGNVATINTTALVAVSSSTTACQGTTAEVVRSDTANDDPSATNRASATLCTEMDDSAGNAVQSETVLYTVAGGGSLSASSATTNTSGVDTGTVVLTHGTTGQNGDVATVTASAGGISDTATVAFGGDAASCTVTTDPTTVEVGGSSTVNIDVVDADGFAVPDNTFVNVIATDPGAGSNSAILGTPDGTANGDASVVLIAAIQGSIALGATTPTTAAGANVTGNIQRTCTASVLATGTVVPPVGTTPDEGDSFSGDVPPSGSATLLATVGEPTPDEVAVSLEAAGCDPESIAVLPAATGTWLVFIPGAPDVVNAAFPDTITQAAFFARCR